VAAHFYVICIEGVIAASGMIDTRSGKMETVFVSPLRMRCGPGREMLIQLERLARNTGLKCVGLQSTLNAVSFYRACGFIGDNVTRYNFTDRGGA